MSPRTLAIFTLLVCASSINYYTQLSQSAKVNSVHFSADAKLLVVCSQGHNNNIYSMGTFSVLYTYAATTNCNYARFSPDQKLIAFGMTGTSIVLFNVYTNNTFAVNKTLTSQFNNIDQLDFRGDSSQLLVCGNAGGPTKGYEIITISTGAVAHANTNLPDQGLSCRFSNTGTYAIGTAGGDTVKANAQTSITICPVYLTRKNRYQS